MKAVLVHGIRAIINIGIKSLVIHRVNSRIINWDSGWCVNGIDIPVEFGLMLELASRINPGFRIRA
jgi:hypothetical protein